MDDGESATTEAHGYVVAVSALCDDGIDLAKQGMPRCQLSPDLSLNRGSGLVSGPEPAKVNPRSGSPPVGRAFERRPLTGAPLIDPTFEGRCAAAEEDFG